MDKENKLLFAKVGRAGDGMDWESEGEQKKPITYRSTYRITYRTRSYCIAQGTIFNILG